MKYLIGVDLGTSATKTILMDAGGRVRLTCSRAYSMENPKNGWAEQDPEVWKYAAIDTIREIIQASDIAPEDVAAIGLSGQMHGLVMLGEDCRPLRSAILWCDQRASQQARQMQDLLSPQRWLELSANPPLAGWTAAKLLWVRENQPELYARCRHILLPKDYVRFALTGRFATDVSDASGMQMLDVRRRCWSEEILHALDIPQEWLGSVYESQEVVGELLPDAAAQCGLTTRTVVVAGGSDNACAGIGTGIVREGQASTSMGTSAVVYTHLDHFRLPPEGGLHLCCCAVPGCWHTMGGPQSAGLSMEWFKDHFCRDLQAEARCDGKDFYALVNELTAAIPPGSDRLIYLPFLMGERTPHMNPWYRGGFVGLNAVHGQVHLLRAIMEGVGYCLADCNDLLGRMGVTVQAMRVCGGGAKSPVWREILAALYRCDVFTLAQEEGPAFGAAILAGVGAGLFPSVREACDRLIREKERTPCRPELAQAYDGYHRLYDQIYEALSSSLFALSQMQ